MPVTEALTPGGGKRPALPAGPFLVLGLARSGEAIALALAERGEQVIGVDSGSSEKPRLAQAAQRLRAAGVEVHLQPSDDGLAHTARTLIKSPGVPHTAPLVRAARASGATVEGELEIAWRLLPNDFIAVTGTNGKTTTTEWIGHVHRAAGSPVAVGGNVGTALSTLIGSVDSAATIVCECSSFQLEDTLQFAPQASLLLNITPDHLDRHGTFENYREAKLRVFSNQTSADLAILPDDIEPQISGAAEQIRFGEHDESALRLLDGRLMWRGTQLMSASDIGLPGAHNLQNAMATASVCLARGLDPDAVADGLRTFSGVAHRLQLVAELREVRYVNDSKATNVASTAVALSAYEPATVHLILGGQAKAQDFSSLASLVQRTCEHIYLIGEDAAKIAGDLQSVSTPVTLSADLRSAVTAATANAAAGDVVLLSPACASFDQFENFEARGEAFVQFVAQVARDVS